MFSFLEHNTQKVAGSWRFFRWSVLAPKQKLFSFIMFHQVASSASLFCTFFHAFLARKPKKHVQKI